MRVIVMILLEMKRLETVVHHMREIPHEAGVMMTKSGKDFMRRAPIWISKAVLSRYAIKSMEVKKSVKRAGASGLKIRGRGKVIFRDGCPRVCGGDPDA